MSVWNDVLNQKPSHHICMHLVFNSLVFKVNQLISFAQIFTHSLDSSASLMICVKAFACLSTLRTSLYGFKLGWCFKSLSQQKGFHAICWKPPCGCISAPTAFKDLLKIQASKAGLCWESHPRQILCFRVGFSLVRSHIGEIGIVELMRQYWKSWTHSCLCPSCYDL